MPSFPSAAVPTNPGRPSPGAPLSAFTVDVEDYFQVSGFADRVPTASWDRYELRVVESTRRLLRLLERRRVRGTFFVLGWVADRCPGLVAEIAGAGHEVGSHGYWHRLVYDQTPEEFRDDLLRSVEAIENAGGGRPTCYRAPSFSITARSRWALDVLAEEGFTVDSSVFPVRRGRYGVPDAPPRVHRLSGPAGGTVWEAPPTVLRVGTDRRGWNLPVAGGGYFRLFPEALTAAAHRRVVGGSDGTGARPVIFYVHPWEVDPDQPRLPGSRTNRFRHYLNLSRTEDRLERLLGRLPFGTLGEVVAAAEHAADPADAPVACPLGPEAAAPRRPSAAPPEPEAAPC